MYQGGAAAWTVILCRGLVVAILMWAVVSKVMFSSAILSGQSLLADKFLLASVVGIEAGCATIVLGAHVRSAWWVIFSLFGGLLPFSIYSLISHVDCGCFGGSVGAWVAPGVDLFVLLAVIVTRHHWVDDAQSNFNKIGRATGRTSADSRIALIGVCVGFACSWVIVSPISVLGQRECLRFIAPKEMVGTRFVLAGNGRDLGVLENGKWCVLLLNPACSHCAQVATDVQQLWDSGHLAADGFAVFSSGGSKWPVRLQGGGEKGDYSISYDWGRCGEPFFAAPAIFVVRDGVVENAEVGNEVDNFVRKWLVMEAVHSFRNPSR